MVINCRIQELGYIWKLEERYVVVAVIVQHNGFVVQEQHWRIHENTPTAAAAQYIANEYDATQWQYQSMWVLHQIGDKPTLLRYVPKMLDTDQ